MKMYKTFIILLIISASELCGMSYGGQFDYIDAYKAESKGYVGETSKPNLIEEVKKDPNYTEEPKEKI